MRNSIVICGSPVKSFRAERLPRVVIPGRSKVNTVTGEPVPPYGVPEQYPFYLEPIPVNTRDTLQVMNEYLDGRAPKVARILYSTFNRQREQITYQEISNAITGRTPYQQLTEAWMERFYESYAAFVNATLAPAWEQAALTGGAHVADGIRQVAPSFSQTPVGMKIQEWVEQRGAQFVTRVTDTQRQAINNILKYYITERPVSAQNLAQIIRGTVGLTTGQADAVRKEREKQFADLIKAREERLGRPLTEAERKKFIAQNTGKVEHQVQNYSARLHRLRAQRIADTEISFAFNRGQFGAVEQADTDGSFAGARVEKYWITAPGCCAKCRALGEMEPRELAFQYANSGSKVEADIPAPPAHPWCRCVIGFRILPLQQPEEAA